MWCNSGGIEDHPWSLTLFCGHLLSDFRLIRHRAHEIKIDRETGVPLGHWVIGGVGGWFGPNFGIKEDIQVHLGISVFLSIPISGACYPSHPAAQILQNKYPSNLSAPAAEGFACLAGLWESLTSIKLRMPILSVLPIGRAALE